MSGDNNSEPGDENRRAPILKSIDHLSAAENLEQQAIDKKEAADSYLRQGILFATIAIIALIFVVVGGEDVVRKLLASLAPNAIEEQAQTDALLASRAVEKFNTISARQADLFHQISQRKQSEQKLKSLNSNLNDNNVFRINTKDAIKAIQIKEEEANREITAANALVQKDNRQLAALEEREADLDASLKNLSNRVIDRQNSADAFASRIKLLETNHQRAIESWNHSIGKIQNSIATGDKELRKLIAQQKKLNDQLKKNPLSKLSISADLQKLVAKLSKGNIQQKKRTAELARLKKKGPPISSATPDLHYRHERMQQELERHRSALETVGIEKTKLGEEITLVRNRISEREEVLSGLEKGKFQIRQNLDKEQRHLSKLVSEEDSLKTAIRDITGKTNPSLPDLERAYSSGKVRLEDAALARDNAQQRARDSKRAAFEASTTGTLQTILTRGGAIAGAVGILILVVQIFVNSTRYNLRLSDLYRAQANALRASNGDLETARLLLENLSPLPVDFGKTPTSLYEKAIDAVRDVAKAKSR